MTHTSRHSDARTAAGELAPSHAAPPRRRPLRRPFRPAIFEAPEAPAVSERDRLYRRGLVLADALAAAVALVVGVTVIGDDTLQPAAALFVPLAVIVSKAIGLYDRDELLLRKTTLDDVPALLQLTTAYTLLAWIMAPLLIDGSLSREQVVGLWGLLFLASLCGRTAARGVARRAAPVERCLLVGDAATGDRLQSQLEDGPGMRAEVADRVELDAAHDLGHSLRRIEGSVRERDIHRVIVAPGAVDSDSVLDAIRLAKGLGVKISLLPRVFEVVGSSIEFDDVGGMTVLGLRRFGLTRSSWFLKRTMDWVGASLALVLSAPVFLLIALAIKLESRGPVLFRQTRVGRDGRRFQMLKFRTMVDGADRMKAALRDRNETSGLFKIADDPRVTRVGRLLRRTSLDELPQLLNVLRGEMSLVGPRPLVVDEDDKVGGWHRRRLHLMPGMTGHWQILGSARIPLHEMVKIDYLYVANWSLWGDVKILLRTIPYLVSRGGM
jgi:exopolysaccharide biosynthesis polyprenyl glycosylphosphotransferase